MLLRTELDFICNRGHASDSIWIVEMPRAFGDVYISDLGLGFAYNDDEDRFSVVIMADHDSCNSHTVGQQSSLRCMTTEKNFCQ